MTSTTRTRRIRPNLPAGDRLGRTTLRALHRHRPMQPQTLFEYVADHVGKRPDHPVYLYEGRAISFGEIDTESARCRGALHELGVSPGDRVAVLMNDCPEMIVALLGIMGMGAIAVPCCTMLSPNELAYVLQDSGARCAVVGADQWPSMDAVRSRVPTLRPMLLAGPIDAPVAGPIGEMPTGVIDFAQALSQAKPVPPAPLSSETLAFIIYTSGSTGNPKGAVHRHGDIPVTVEVMAREIYEMSPEERLYSGPRLYFGYGFSNSLSFPLGTGVTCILTRERATAPVVADVLRRYRPTIFLGVPANFRALIDYRDQGHGLDARSLHFSVSAGERLSAQLFHKWKALTGGDILDTYGTSELLHGFITNRKGRVRPGSCGQAVRGYEIRLVDDDGRLIEGVGTGALYVKGESAISQYWNKPQETAKAIQDGWVRTGDIYRRDKDGFYFFEGRVDDTFKSSGMWVSPSEIEEVLCSHAAVHESAVISEPGPGGDNIVVAFVALRKGHIPGDALREDILSCAAQSLSRYKRPSTVRFASHLPRTPTGKVQRFKLRAMFKQPDESLPLAG
jgi:benzoate-CoA ligase family protein